MELSSLVLTCVAIRREKIKDMAIACRHSSYSRTFISLVSLSNNNLIFKPTVNLYKSHLFLDEMCFLVICNFFPTELHLPILCVTFVGIMSHVTPHV